jgi:hypothetical protein
MEINKTGNCQDTAELVKQVKVVSNLLAIMVQLQGISCMTNSSNNYHRENVIVSLMEQATREIEASQ